MQKQTEQIIKSILAIQDTNELRTVSNALHQHRTYMNAQATRNFIVGDVIDLVVSASKGELNINVVEKAAVGCCLAILKTSRDSQRG